MIKLFDYKQTQNNYYLMVEYCSNGDLDNYLRNNSTNGTLPEAQVKMMAIQILDALIQVNKLRIVHRDLKLANILLNSDCEIKLADFGFARFFEEEILLQSYCGTPITMAPEILKRLKYTDKCDVWSFGVILY